MTPTAPLMPRQRGRVAFNDTGKAKTLKLEHDGAEHALKVPAGGAALLIAGQEPVAVGADAAAILHLLAA